MNCYLEGNGRRLSGSAAVLGTARRTCDREHAQEAGQVLTFIAYMTTGLDVAKYAI